ncbi:MAG: hypothetical protein HQL56_10055 [Magnetococcales bacterium]|nr:hypothetical protein [Magnetococcales bacterium]
MNSQYVLATISAIPGIASLLTNLITRTGMPRWVNAAGLLVTALGFTWLILLSSSVSISNYNSGTVISDCSNKTTSEQIIINPVRVFVPSQMDVNGKYVTLFAKVAGGTEWWATSNSIESRALESKALGSEGVFGFVTVGTKNDGNSDYVIAAGLTNKQHRSGDVYSILPADMSGVSTINIVKRCS